MKRTSVSVCGLAAVALLALPAGAQIVANGQFDGGLDDWTLLKAPGTVDIMVNPLIFHPNPPGYGKLDSIDPGCDYDCESFWVGSNNTNPVDTALYQVIDLTPGTKYVASCLFGGDTGQGSGEGNPGSIYIAPASWTDFGQGESLVAQINVGENAWGTANGSFTASAAQHTLIIRLQATGGTIGVDAVSVVPHVPVTDRVVDTMNGAWSFWPDRESGGSGNNRSCPVTEQYEAPWAAWRGPWANGTWNAARQNPDSEGDPEGFSLIIGCAGNGGGGISRNFINLVPGEYYIELDIRWPGATGPESWIAYEVNRTDFKAGSLLADGDANAFARGDMSDVWKTIQTDPFTINTADSYVTFWAYGHQNGLAVQMDNVSIVRVQPPCESDIDGDNVCDEDEGPNIGLPAGSSNILLVDSDGDGLWDGVEDANRSGSKDANESSTRDRDTDDDNFEDGIEILLGFNPLVPEVGYLDADNDGLPNSVDPNSAKKDTDGDGFDDGYEAAWFQNAGAANNAAQAPPLGDVNGDSFVVNLDALVMQSLFLGNIEYSHTVFDQGPAHIDGYRFADPSRDGFVTSLDALVVQSYFLGNIATIPLRF